MGDNVKEKQKEDEDEDVEEEEEEDDSLDVVHKALAAIIGENPSEEQKLSQEVFAAVLELDEFLKEEEERRQKEKKVDTLLSSALDFIDSAVERRESAAERLGLLKNKKKHLDIEEVIAELLKQNN